ncbi:MAG: fused MFS/spermidine synthase [Candidatus Kuenenbacteria bacterium]
MLKKVLGIKNFLLEIIVFICGGVVMVFEIVGSRVLGPYIGTSIFVWTSIIGVILGSLSIGYWLGGKIADKKPTYSNLSLIIFLAAIFITITILIKKPFLFEIQKAAINFQLKSILSSLILFAPASILLGIISPYAVKLKMNNLDTSGRTVGNLYAISTIGSITGTFLAGFYLIPRFGTTRILIFLSIILLIISLAAFPKHLLKLKLSASIFLLALLILTAQLNTLYIQKGFVDVDTQYNRVWIYNSQYPPTGQAIKKMNINNENSSAMFLETDELVYDCTKYYHLVEYFNPGFQKTLMIGGAAYSFPKDFLAKYQNGSIDVIEIDPKLTQLAQKYFRLDAHNPRLNIFHQDARIFLNLTHNKYDAIFTDAFKSQYSIPYQLTTLEIVKKKYDLLNQNGLVILNIISAMGGEKNKFLKAEYLTYKKIFPQVYLFPVQYPFDEEKIQNVILVALKSEQIPSFESPDKTINKYLQHRWRKEIKTDLPILTDDYAPVDYYASQAI